MKKKDQDITNPERETLDQCINNFRFGIKDQNASFNAMDVKANIFISILVIVIVLLMQSIFDMNIGEYHPVCQIIIYTMGFLLFISMVVNLVFGFMAIRGRKMRNGVLSQQTLNDLHEAGDNIQEEICAKLSKAYSKNESKYKNKVKNFLITQNLWIVNLVSSLIFMLVLTVIKLGYE